MELGETIEKVARGENREGILNRKKVIEWAEEQVGRSEQWVDEHFDFSESPKIKVEGNLLLNICSNLKFLPDNLEVEGQLNLMRSANLESLPDNLKVGASLWVRGCKSGVIKKAHELKKQGNIKSRIIF